MRTIAQPYTKDNIRHKFNNLKRRVENIPGEWYTNNYVTNIDILYLTNSTGSSLQGKSQSIPTVADPFPADNEIQTETPSHEFGILGSTSIN